MKSNTIKRHNTTTSFKRLVSLSLTIIEQLDTEVLHKSLLSIESHFSTALGTHMSGKHLRPMRQTHWNSTWQPLRLHTVTDSKTRHFKRHVGPTRQTDTRVTIVKLTVKPHRLSTYWNPIQGTGTGTLNVNRIWNATSGKTGAPRVTHTLWPLLS